MKKAFTNFCEAYFNGVVDFVSRVLFCGAVIVALFTVGNIICPIF